MYGARRQKHSRKRTSSSRAPFSQLTSALVVDADIHSISNRTRDKAVGVREIERQPQAMLWREDRLTVRHLSKPPRPGHNVRILRERSPEQRMSRGIVAPVFHRHESAES
jgi:hypothetical protein